MTLGNSISSFTCHFNIEIRVIANLFVQVLQIFLLDIIMKVWNIYVKYYYAEYLGVFTFYQRIYQKSGESLCVGFHGFQTSENSV